MCCLTGADPVATVRLGSDGVVRGRPTSLEDRDNSAERLVHTLLAPCATDTAGGQERDEEVQPPSSEEDPALFDQPISEEEP